MISTAQRVKYASGYVALGLLDLASDELEAVDFRDRFSIDVMTARLALHTAAEQWDVVASFARRLLGQDPDDVDAWISLGCAVRRTEGLPAAKAVLLKIEPTHGSKHAVIQFNLACYNCLLGDIATAKHHLTKACQMDARFKAMALDDPDLESMWAQITAL